MPEYKDFLTANATVCGGLWALTLTLFSLAAALGSGQRAPQDTSEREYRNVWALFAYSAAPIAFVNMAFLFGMLAALVALTPGSSQKTVAIIAFVVATINAPVPFLLVVYARIVKDLTDQIGGLVVEAAFSHASTSSVLMVLFGYILTAPIIVSAAATFAIYVWFGWTLYRIGQPYIATTFTFTALALGCVLTAFTAGYFTWSAFLGPYVQVLRRQEAGDRKADP